VTTNFQGKILTRSELVRVASNHRQAGKTIVQCHGCFDIVHPGHIRYLEFARQKGDILVVSLTGDQDVHKGANRPYIPQELRAENLAALVFVDYVCINASPTAVELIRDLQPNIYVKGREYEGSTDEGFLAEKTAVESYGGRIIYSSGEIVFSSTALIDKLPQANVERAHRLKQTCRKHDVSSDALARLLDRVRGLKVLVVGDVILDRYIFCDALGIASEAPVVSLAHRDERCYVGGAAIVARHVASLGAKSFLLSAASGSNDINTGLIRDTLRREDVGYHLVAARPAIVEKTRFLAEDCKLFKVDRAQRCPLDSIAQREAATLLEKQSRTVDAVILCDFGYGMITESLLNRVLPVLRQNVKIVTADVSGGRANLKNFKNVDLLCPTEREIRAMLNDHDSGLSSVAWELLDQTQARHIIVTLEKRGMLVFERASADRSAPQWSARLKGEQLPAFATHAVDHLGCGDALLAGATVSLAAGGTLMQSAYLGNAAAAIEVGILGNHPVTRTQLRDWIETRPEVHATDPPKPSAAVSAPADHVIYTTHPPLDMIDTVHP